MGHQVDDANQQEEEDEAQKDVANTVLGL